jgi:predicted heme/steroid binding protein
MIKYTENIIYYSIHPHQKYYYKNQLTHLKKQLQELENQKNNSEKPIEREFTLEELGKYDGSNGKDAYIAINGVVYDVSYEGSWGGGTHAGLVAGNDYTKEFAQCHNSKLKYIKDLPVVGKLKE